ncbi:MAG TPA: creatininase family protein, partial [Clostridia bacterium]|nr:creatininase family protein [Clostridia bacterium]
MNQNEVRWERMRPWQMREALENLPVCYLPLGNVEWHGEYNALGLDAIKAHDICIRAVRISGGAVYPPVYGGMGAVDLLG